MLALWFAIGACIALTAMSWTYDDADRVRFVCRFSAPVILLALVIAAVAWRAA